MPSPRGDQFQASDLAGSPERRAPEPLSDVERKILDFMVEYLRSNTYQPSIREIGHHFGIKSTKTVSEHLQALEAKGYLERDPSRSRGVRILGMNLRPETVTVPCYAEIPAGNGAGSPSEVEMQLSVDRRLAGGKGAFFVRARGEELGALGISEGDLLLVEPSDGSELSDGDLVAVRLDDTPTLKRVAWRDGSLALSPLAGSGAPVAVGGDEDVSVAGRVVALYRRLDGLAGPGSTLTH